MEKIGSEMPIKEVKRRSRDNDIEQQPMDAFRCGHTPSLDCMTGTVAFRGFRDISVISLPAEFFYI
jgi:hypothetical protein